MAGDVLSGDADLDLGTVVAGLRESRDVLHNVRYRGPVRPPPSRAAIEEMLGQFARALFPAHYGQLERRDPALPPTPEMIDDYVGSVLEQALTALHDHLRRTLPFTDAEPGMAGAETLLTLALTLVRDEVIDLPRLFALLSANPARLLGLPGGVLAVGAEADLILVDPDTPWRIDADRMAAKAGNTPFDGLPVQGKVIRTIKGGRALG